MKKSATSIPGIYVITNMTTGTVYIGQAVNIRRRWESHRHYLAANKHGNRYLQNAWNKYGADAFKFSIHTSFADLPMPSAKFVLDAAEIEAIKLFPDTYNLMDAGISAPLAGPETRAIWSKQRLEMWASAEFKAKRSEATKKLYQDPEWKAARDAAVREAKGTPEERAKAKEHFDRIWQDPEHQKRQSEMRRANWQTPEYAAQQKASRMASWQDPEKRARRIAGLKAAWARRKLQAATS